MSQYTPIVGNDEEKYALAERSTARLQDLQELRARSLAVQDHEREQLASRYGVEEPFEDEVSPPEYYKRAFEILAAGVESLDDKRDVRFHVVEEMIDDFLPTGGGGQSAPANIWDAFVDT